MKKLFIVLFAAVLTAFSTGLSASQGEPTVPKERGIYLAQADAAPAALLQARITGMKASGGMKAALSYGAAKMKMKVLVRGGRADVRATEQPTFYLSGFEPADIVVFRLDSKGKEREFLMGTYGGFLSSTMKTAEGDVEFKAEKIEGGYKLTFPAGLKAGEYGFAYMPASAGPMGSSALYDFGIDTAASR